MLKNQVPISNRSQAKISSWSKDGHNAHFWLTYINLKPNHFMKTYINILVIFTIL